MLESAGAGNYFIRTAFAGLGHLRGGPAKAAVVSSGLTGLVSGSSIANVVTTGTFTIPLMKKVGYRPHVAGAIEAASLEANRRGYNVVLGHAHRSADEAAAESG